MEGVTTCPQILSLHDLEKYGEAFSKGKDNVQTLKYTWITYVDAESNAYFGQTSVGPRQLSPQDAQDCLKRIPEEGVYPEAPSDVSVFSEPVPAHFHVKRPDLASWDIFEGTDTVAKLFLDEVEAYELLRKQPHPNLAGYRGCVIRQNRITCIVLDRYPTTLKDAFLDHSEIKLDKQQRDAIFHEIQSVTDHLHSLGLAHNDLNPMNIMLDKVGKPHLIDFASCKPLGTVLDEGGTAGWIDNHSSFSDRRHDEYALGKIRTWLDEQ